MLDFLEKLHVFWVMPMLIYFPVCNFMTQLQRINWHQENVNVNEYRFQQVEGLEKY